MLNLLVISPQDDVRERLCGLLSGSTDKVTCRLEAAQATPLVERGIFDAVLVAPAGASEHTLDEIRLLHKARTEGFLIVVVDQAPLAWEEAALGAGADAVLREPISTAHLESALRRVGTREQPNVPQQAAAHLLPRDMASANRGGLEILRDFSHILGYSLDHKLFAEQFVQKVREIVGVARIAVFLESPRDAVVEPTPNPRLSCAAAVGITPDILECFELSRAAGIGARMTHAPQILQAGGDPRGLLSAGDQKVQREFEILGCQVAVPITDRTRTIGVAMLGGHFTGRGFTPDELQLLFLLMEELGCAIKNTWLHKQVSASHQLLADVLAALSSGCLVVDRNLHVLHANRAMFGFIKGNGTLSGSKRMEFADLPQKLAAPLYDCVVKGTKPASFFFTGGADAGRLYHVSIIAFRGNGDSLPQSAMLVLEDFTQIEAAKRFEIEASKAKLIALIAKRFAHEIRNSLVPLATHEQLLESEYQSDDFRKSLKSALARETSRIQRFTEQMLYLAQPARTPTETANVRDVIEACFARVNGSVAPAGRLQVRSESDLPLVRCHQPALEHAFQEILTNALQTPGNTPVVTVNITPGAENGIRVTLRDAGPGFNEDTARQSTEPFFTTRNTGIGLGLTVARKIIEDHHGRITIAPRRPERDFDLEIWLPAATSV